MAGDYRAPETVPRGISKYQHYMVPQLEYDIFYCTIAVVLYTSNVPPNNVGNYLELSLSLYIYIYYLKPKPTSHQPLNPLLKGLRYCSSLYEILCL